jgi:putative ABC transport system permease protein
MALALWSSVLSRTSEIGLRRALGASERDIAVQFIMEASLVAVAAIVVGGVVGPVASWLIARSQGWPVVLDWPLLAATCVLALETTLIVGLLPARRAARLDPLGALRT